MLLFTSRQACTDSWTLRCYIQSAAIHVQKCRLSQRSRECHMTMVVQPRVQLVMYKIAMWVQGVRNTVTMEVNSDR